VPPQFSDAGCVQRGLRRFDEIRERIVSDDYDYPEGLCDPQEIESLLDWEDSARLWLTDAGREWPGGRRNLNLMCAKLIELGLVEAADKVGALTVCFESLRDAGELEEPEEDDHA